MGTPLQLTEELQGVDTVGRVRVVPGAVFEAGLQHQLVHVSGQRLLPHGLHARVSNQQQRHHARLLRKHEWLASGLGGEKRRDPALDAWQNEVREGVGLQVLAEKEASELVPVG